MAMRSAASSESWPVVSMCNAIHSGFVLFANILLLVAVHDAAPDDPLQILG